MGVEISENDNISRCIIWERFFEQNVHTNAKLWAFGQALDDGAAHESAVLRSLAPKDSDVHRIGCGIAEAQNNRRSNPAPGPDRRYYCGFRTARVGDIATSGDGYTLSITNVPEHGETAHVDVALFITVVGKSAKANRRTNAGLSIAEQFSPPVSHICDCDLNDQHHPILRFGKGCLSVGVGIAQPLITQITPYIDHQV